MQRPAGVTIIAILGFVVGAVAAIEGLLIWVNRGSFFGAGTSFYFGGGFAGLVLLGGAALVIVTCIGLLKLQEWARILAIVLNAAHLVMAALGLMDAFRHLHTPFFVGVMLRHIVMLAIGIWIIVYLIQPRVRKAFRASASAAS
jgi:hypothetical protein